MADRYFVGGGTGNWNSTTNWSATDGGSSGASFPVSGDNANFTALSGAGALNVNVASVCANLVMSATFTGSLTGTGTLGIEGSASFGGTVSHTGTKTFTSTAAGNTITSNSVILASVITFNGVNGAWTLADALSTSGTLGVSNGAFDALGFSVTFSSFSSNNSNIRSVSGSGSWTATGPALAWSTGTSTNLGGTLSSMTLTVSNAGATGVSAGNTMGNLNVTNASGTFTTGTATGNSWNNINFTGATCDWNAGTHGIRGNLTLASGMMASDTSNIITFRGTSGTQLIASNGVTLNHALTIATTGVTVQAVDSLNTGTQNITLNSGTFDANGKTIKSRKFVSNSATARTLTGVSAITWEVSGTGEAWSISDPGSNFNFQAPAVIKYTDTSSVTKNLGLDASQPINTLWFAGAGTGINNISITADRTIAELKIDSAPKSFTFGSGCTTNIGLLTGFTGTAGNLIIFASTAPGSPYTMVKTGERFIGDYISVRDCLGAPAHKWYYGKGAVNAGNNSGWEWNGVYPGGGASAFRRQQDEDEAEIKEILAMQMPLIEQLLEERA